MAKKDNDTFVRYGGLSLVKQKGYDPSMPTFHSPPNTRGIYAFPILSTNNINEPGRSGVSGMYSKDHFEVFIDQKIG